MAKTKRKHCRICSALAGVTTDICNGCRMAEVRRHIKRKAPMPKGQELHTAYSKSLASLPTHRVSNVTYGVNAVASALDQGFASASSAHDFGSETLCNAQRFAATLATVPPNVQSAQVFFSYAQKSFYNHMRAIMSALDGTKKLPKRKRKTPSSDRSKHVNVKAHSEQNILLSKALRFLRIYMQMEVKPLALKLGCSATQIWHIEAANNIIFPKWVAEYARVFEVKEAGIYAYANALGHGRAVKGCPKDMLRKFVSLVIG